MNDLERSVVSRASETMRILEGGLLAAGLTWSGPDYELWCEDDDNYTSELRITLLKNGEIEDILEFHIYRDGDALVTVEDVEEWLREQVSTLVASGREL